MKIFKYTIDKNDHGEFVLEMPENCVILRADVQDHMGQIWAIVDPKAPKVEKRFFLALTGMELPKQFFGKWHFIGTCLFGDNQSYVTHVFKEA